MTRLYEFEGDLWDTEGRVVRKRYAWHHRTIESIARLKASLRAGDHVWPGGYGIVYMSHDGELIHSRCVRENFRYYARAALDHDPERIVAACLEEEIESAAHYCAECHEQIGGDDD